MGPQEPYTFIPIFLILRFIFYVGWLEVAEAIENPFGNDEDDFHICQLVSRHLWAIGRNLALHDGPPVPDNNGEDNDDEDNEEIPLKSRLSSIMPIKHHVNQLSTITPTGHLVLFS